MSCCRGGGRDVDVAERERSIENVHPDNAVEVKERATFAGPHSDRRCTDLMWMVLLIAHWGVVTWLGFSALGWVNTGHVRQGKPRILSNWMDHNGFICGTRASKGLVDEKPLVYFPNPQGRIYEDVDDFAFDDAAFFFATQSGPNVGKVPSSLYSICVRECPGDNEVIEDPTSCDMSGCDSWETYKTTRFVNYCVPRIKGVDLENKALASKTDRIFDFWKNFFGDIVVARIPIAISGTLVAVIVGFSYLQIIRLPGVLSIMIWGSILLCFLALVGLGAACNDVFVKMKDVDDDEVRDENDPFKKTARVFTFVFWVAAFLLVCFVCCMRKAIWLAIGVIKEAARCTSDMVSIVFVPYLQSLCMLLFVIPWFIYCIYIATAGTRQLVERDKYGALPMPYYTFEATKSQSRALFYMLFSLFWTHEFILALGQITVATAAATWYFTRDKAQYAGFGTVRFAMSHTIWYHGGTAAFGALIVAVVKLFRTVMMYIQCKVEKALSGKSKCLACLARVVFCIIQCCLYCLEKCIRFINKEAYIQTAIFGYSFCTAARKGFFLVARNVRRVAAVEAIGGFVFAVAKLMIAVVSGLFCLSWLLAYYEEETTNVVFPTMIATFLAYNIADSFVGVVDMVSDTLLVCFIADEEIFGIGSPDSFATKSLQSYVNLSNQAMHVEARFINDKPANRAARGPSRSTNV